MKSPSSKKKITPTSDERALLANDEIKQLISDIQSEPFPTDASLEKENTSMTRQEHDLGKFLTPLKKLEQDSSPLRQKRKTVRKKNKK